MQNWCEDKLKLNFHQRKVIRQRWLSNCTPNYQTYSKILFSTLSGSIALLPSSGNSLLHLWDASVSCSKPLNLSAGIYVLHLVHLTWASSLTKWDLLPALPKWIHVLMHCVTSFYHSVWFLCYKI